MSDLASFVVDRRDDIVIAELTGESICPMLRSWKAVSTDAVPNDWRGWSSISPE